MELNKVYNQDFLTNSLPDKCANLIIADPPYFEVKGEFDFIWPSFEAYLLDVEKWAKECKRLLADNGTLFWWGHAKKIAYSQVILDKYFLLENSCVWEKKDGQAKKNKIESMRSYAPVTERCLFYSNYNQGKMDWKNKNASVYWEGWEEVRLYLRQCVNGFGLKKAADLLGVSDRAVGHYITKSQFFTPNESNYTKLLQAGCFYMPWVEFNAWVCEKKEMESRDTNQRRPFNNLGYLQLDVWHESQEAHITAQWGHDTGKPETLTRKIILTNSNLSDLVVVPFAGSGTECAMAAKEGRNFVGFDIDPKHAGTSNKRASRHLQNNALF
jgi:site-specific DNA-methyltransferase (adenine-specific)